MNDRQGVPIDVPIATGPNHVANRFPASDAKIWRTMFTAKHTFSLQCVHSNPSALFAAGYASTAVAKTCIFKQKQANSLEPRSKSRTWPNRYCTCCTQVLTSNTPPRAAKQQQIGIDCSNSRPDMAGKKKGFVVLESAQLLSQAFSAGQSDKNTCMQTTIKVPSVYREAPRL